MTHSKQTSLWLALGTATAMAFGVVACVGEPPSDDTDDNQNEYGDSGATGSVTSTTGATTTGATATVSSSTTGGGQDCGSWPGGTAGKEVGETIPDMEWTGLRPGGTTEEAFSLDEFRKCNGMGPDVIIIDTSGYT